mmetsp:Transcript_26653/g.81904  ORF Transcript_26653/g.81904 Transcript_26653/m.81904 type:complete len:86 (+) Transcript_26653:595-852(+)
MQGRAAVVAGLRDIRSVVEQKPDHGEVASLGREEDRRTTFILDLPDVGTFEEQEASNVDVTQFASDRKWRHAIVPGHADVGASLK